MSEETRFDVAPGPGAAAYDRRAAGAAGQVALSVVVPLYNEEESVPPLVDAVRAALGPGADWELLLVDDGSSDATARRAGAAAEADPRVRVLRLARNYGQTAAMQAGFDHARGVAIVSMDGDLQNDPADIPRLVEALAGGYDLVAGYRVGRRDRLLTRKVPSWIANRLIQWLTGVPIRDNGCSLKAYRRETIERMHLYSDMHRFIPAVAASTAGARITEIPVRHHARRYGASKYGLSRVAKVLLDLLTIKMIRTFRDQPLALFALAALAAAVLGILFAGAAAISIVRRAADPGLMFVLPGVAMLWLGLACYLFMLGLIAEVVLRQQPLGMPRVLPVAREVVP